MASVDEIDPAKARALLEADILKVRGIANALYNVTQRQNIPGVHHDDVKHIDRVLSALPHLLSVDERETKRTNEAFDLTPLELARARLAGAAELTKRIANGHLHPSVSSPYAREAKAIIEGVIHDLAALIPTDEASDVA